MIETDIAVVGGGLAAFSAALQSARLGHSCAVLSGAVPGGLLLSIESIQGLPGHPDGIAGYELCPMLQEQAMDAGAQCLNAEAQGLRADGAGWQLQSTEGELRARSVIVASGCRLRHLGVPGEERLFGKGVSQCASCDAPLLRGRAVAVVGGGDSACQEALTLAEHASVVHLLVRGSKLRAQAAWQRQVLAQPKIQLHWQTTVQAIEGDPTVSALRLLSTAGGSEVLAVEGVFVFVGLVPNTEWLGPLLPLDDDGRIRVDAGLHTSRPGLLAAGSVRAQGGGQALGAAADGVAAALAAHRHLVHGNWPA